MLLGQRKPRQTNPLKPTKSYGKQSELVDLLIHRLRTYITLNEKEKQQFDEYKTFKNRLNGPELNPIKKGIWEEELQNNPFFKTPQRVLALEEIENQQLMKTMLQTTYLNLLAYATEYARQQENEITKQVYNIVIFYC